MTMNCLQMFWPNEEVLSIVQKAALYRHGSLKYRSLATVTGAFRGYNRIMV